MIKRLSIALLSLMMVFTNPLQTSAATIMYWLYYIPGLDQYKMDFTYPTGSTWFNLHFEGAGGYVVDRPYNLVPTGVMYLTCNGTYSMQFYDSSNSQIGAFFPFQTTQIMSPTCDSYPKATGSDDLNSSVTDLGGDNYKVDWMPPPAGGHSEVYKDGQLVYSGPDGTYTGGKGSYTIINYDSGGNEIGRTDKYVPDGYDGTGGTGGDGETEQGGTGGGSCSGCDKLREMLGCPEWDDYMGDLTQAIKNALPPPPDWPAIADVFVDKFAEYFGDPPPVPSKAQIETNITPSVPPLNTAVPEADMQLEVPSVFDQPFEFDITTGPEISVEDGSEPIEIKEPGDFLDSDPPGTFVYPGDPRNDSQGIKQPDAVDTGVAKPTPTVDQGSEIPPTDMPVPSGGGSTMPVPTDPGGIIPIPTIHEPIPIPNMPPGGG